MIAPSGRLLLASLVIIVPLAAIAGMSPALAPACLALLLLCAVVALADAVQGRRRAESIRASAPALLRITKSIDSVLPLALENLAGHALHLRIAVPLPEGLETPEVVRDIEVPAGKSSVEWQLAGHARGDFRVDAVHIETPSLAGLWSARAELPLETSVRVYPNLRDSATAGLFLKTRQIGIRMYRQVGKGREFENLRQYMPGDSFEDIHWKATAKRNYPAVKLYRVEHAQELYAVVDSSRLSAREGILESYVDAALYLALVAERQGDRFGLATFSDHTQKFVRAGNGMDHFRLCRETIYNLQAQRVSPDFRDIFTTLATTLRRRALLIFFTSLDDALLAETFQREVSLLARRHVVLVNVPQTGAMQPLFTGAAPGDLDSAYGRLAGQMLWNRMRTLKIALQNRGVRLAVVDPARIKTEVAAQYMDVKRRQLL